MLAIAVMILGLSAPASQEDSDKIIAAYMDLMKLTFACEGGSGKYRSTKESALRALKQYDATSISVRDITNLDRGLRSGETKPSAAIDISDCENLIIEAKSDLDDLVDKSQ